MKLPTPARIQPQRGFTLISAGRLGTLRSCQWRSSDINAQPQKGFTLIELLVSIAIIGLMVGVAIPSFNSFSQRQALENAQDDVISTLRLAQSKAIASEVDLFKCDISKTAFLGWYVQIQNGSSTYNISGRCINNQVLQTHTDFNTRSFRLPNGFTFGQLTVGSTARSALYILFKPVSIKTEFYDVSPLPPFQLPQADCNPIPSPNPGDSEAHVCLDKGLEVAGVTQATFIIEKLGVGSRSVSIKTNGEIAGL